MSSLNEQGQHCPVCGKRNDCSMANKNQSETNSCWCMQIQLSDSVKTRLAKLPQKNACVCKDCLAQMAQSQQ